jgi:peptidoglycan/xylan/chitin deacetylase (PgdA/CDA1 family)
MRRRKLAAVLVERSGAGAALRLSPTWRGLLVLCYHRIRDGAAPPTATPGTWSATQDQLDEQLRLLTRHFDVVAPSDLLDGPDLRRQRLVAVTFDDGYRDNYTLALPALRARGVRAAFFIATGFIDRPRPAWWDEIAWMVWSSTRQGLPAGGWLGRPLGLVDDTERRAAVATLTDLYKRLPNHQTDPFLESIGEATGSGRRDAAAAQDDWMTWDMVRELRAAGMDVGGHTVNHPVLARLSEEQQQAEVEQCRSRLEAELGVDMRLFAYPVGLRDSFDTRTRACLARARVALAFSLHGGYVRGWPWDPYDIPRASVGPDAAAVPFRAMTALPGMFARW